MGAHRAIVGDFEVDDRRGVIGRVRTGSAIALVGLDDQDALYAAGPEPALFRTRREERDEAASHGAALPLPGATEIPVPAGVDARGAAIAGSVVVIAGSDAVLVSKDRGARFERSVPFPLDTVETVHARPDGAIVLAGRSGGERKVVMSPDAGRRWIRSSYVPPAIEQAGATLWNGDARCPAVLAVDGRSWVGLPEAAPFVRVLQERSWAPLVRAAREVRIEPAIARISFAEPAAPTAAAAVLSVPPCMGESDVPGGPDVAEADRLLPSLEDGGRVITPARLEEGLIAVPEGCRRGHLIGERGHAVLLCAQGEGSVLHAIGALPEAPGFRHVGMLPYPPDAIADIPSPADARGRRIFHHRDCTAEGPCRAVLSTPGGGAREVRVAGARAYWPGAGDAVVAVVIGEEGSRFALKLVEVAAAGSARVIVETSGEGAVDEVRTDAAGVVEVVVVVAGARRTAALAADGRLVPRP